MEVNAKIGKNLKQIQIQRRGDGMSYLMTLKAAKDAHEAGKITKHNKAFQRLVDNDFDVKATLAWYRERRKQIAAEKRDEAGS